MGPAGLGPALPGREHLPLTPPCRAPPRLSDAGAHARGARGAARRGGEVRGMRAQSKHGECWLGRPPSATPGAPLVCVCARRASARLPVLLPLLAHVDPAARLGAARLVGIAAATLTHEGEGRCCATYVEGSHGAQPVLRRGLLRERARAELRALPRCLLLMRVSVCSVRPAAAGPVPELWAVRTTPGA